MTSKGLEEPVITWAW